MKLAQTAFTKNVDLIGKKRQEKGQNELNLGLKRKPFLKKPSKR